MAGERDCEGVCVCVCLCVCVSSLWLGDGGWLNAQRSEAQYIQWVFFLGGLVWAGWTLGNLPAS